MVHRDTVRCRTAAKIVTNTQPRRQNGIRLWWGCGDWDKMSSTEILWGIETEPCRKKRVTVCSKVVGGSYDLRRKQNQTP